MKRGGTESIRTNPVRFADSDIDLLLGKTWLEQHASRDRIDADSGADRREEPDSHPDDATPSVSLPPEGGSHETAM